MYTPPVSAGYALGQTSCCPRQLPLRFSVPGPQNMPLSSEKLHQEDERCLLQQRASPCVLFYAGRHILWAWAIAAAVEQQPTPLLLPCFPLCTPQQTSSPSEFFGVLLPVSCMSDHHTSVSHCRFAMSRRSSRRLQLGGGPDLLSAYNQEGCTNRAAPLAVYCLSQYCTRAIRKTGSPLIWSLSYQV